MEEEKNNGRYARVGFNDGLAIRRKGGESERESIWRPSFAHDIDKIVHCPYYNRYSDKTQVFSLVKNDDVTRRGLHVQLVSRIARTIGGALNLNLDLIEAIALGHDMGHPPFAHTGEVYLDELYRANTGRRFLHNLQSVRVLDKVFFLNLTLQTLDGIACHNGELELCEYHPAPLSSFEEFDAMIERATEDMTYANKIMPSTLEGAVVRISDIIAYLGKDRQDASRISPINESFFSNNEIGSINSEIINNLVVNIIENSYGKPYIKLDEVHFAALREAKKENYSLIYKNSDIKTDLSVNIKPMMAQIYSQMLDDLAHGNRYSPIFTHHLDYVNAMRHKYENYERTEPNQIVVDYIASMTDDYFIELHAYLFPNSEHKVCYKGYFD